MSSQAHRARVPGLRWRHGRACWEGELAGQGEVSWSSPPPTWWCSPSPWGSWCGTAHRGRLPCPAPGSRSWRPRPMSRRNRPTAPAGPWWSCLRKPAPRACSPGAPGRSTSSLTGGTGPSRPGRGPRPRSSSSRATRSIGASPTESVVATGPGAVPQSVALLHHQPVQQRRVSAPGP